MITDKELEEFASGLKDRFGALPKQTLELIETIKLRQKAREMGIEKLVLKRDRMTATIAFERGSSYFESETFTNILLFAQAYPNILQLKESQEKLSIVFSPIKSISQALKTLSQITNLQ